MSLFFFFNVQECRVGNANFEIEFLHVPRAFASVPLVGQFHPNTIPGARLLKRYVVVRNCVDGSHPGAGNPTLPRTPGRLRRNVLFASLDCFDRPSLPTSSQRYTLYTRFFPVRLIMLCVYASSARYTYIRTHNGPASRSITEPSINACEITRAPPATDRNPVFGSHSFPPTITVYILILLSVWVLLYTFGSSSPGPRRPWLDDHYFKHIDDGDGTRRIWQNRN